MTKYMLLLLILLSACKKQNNKPNQNPQITGRWELASYGGGFDGRTYKVRADSVYLVFKADQTYQRIVQGRIQTQGNYELGKARSIYSGQMDNAIKLGNTDHWEIIEISQTTLNISSNAYDGGGSTYVRK